MGVRSLIVVILREPLKPTRPALDQPMEWPCMSVMVTMVLLKVARMLAMPMVMFLAPLALTIFLPAMSSASSSAAVGAAARGAAPGAAASPGFAASGAAAPAAAGAPASAAAAAAFLGVLAFSAFSPEALAGFSPVSALAS